MFAKTATAISDIYILVPLFLLPLVPLPELLLTLVMATIAICELIILMTYIPRLIAIARGQHDTFT